MDDREDRHIFIWHLRKSASLLFAVGGFCRAFFHLLVCFQSRLSSSRPPRPPAAALQTCSHPFTHCVKQSRPCTVWPRVRAYVRDWPIGNKERFTMSANLSLGQNKELDLGQHLLHRLFVEAKSKLISSLFHVFSEKRSSCACYALINWQKWDTSHKWSEAISHSLNTLCELLFSLQEKQWHIPRFLDS